jgi:hypothetical protein
MWRTGSETRLRYDQNIRNNLDWNRKIYGMKMKTDQRFSLKARNRQHFFWPSLCLMTWNKIFLFLKNHLNYMKSFKSRARNSCLFFPFSSKPKPSPRHHFALVNKELQTSSIAHIFCLVHIFKVPANLESFNLELFYNPSGARSFPSTCANNLNYKKSPQ